MQLVEGCNLLQALKTEQDASIHLALRVFGNIPHLNGTKTTYDMQFRSLVFTKKGSAFLFTGTKLPLHLHIHKKGLFSWVRCARNSATRRLHAGDLGSAKNTGHPSLSAPRERARRSQPPHISELINHFRKNPWFSGKKYRFEVHIQGWSFFALLTRRVLRCRRDIAPIVTIFEVLRGIPLM